jgi:enoyl-CoA hydratase/carnithine racemase
MLETSDDPICYEVSGGIALIGMARPPVNALDRHMVRAVIAAFKQAADDDAVRAVVLASAVAKRFCAGLDIVGLVGKSLEQIRTLVHELYVGVFEAQYHLGKPSIAAVNGPARGGGMTLAVSCDVVLAGESATFGYPEIDLGVLPAIHFVHLPRIIGRHRAFELCRCFACAECAAGEQHGSAHLPKRAVRNSKIDAASRNQKSQLSPKCSSASLGGADLSKAQAV